MNKGCHKAGNSCKTKKKNEASNCFEEKGIPQKKSFFPSFLPRPPSEQPRIFSLTATTILANKLSAAIIITKKKINFIYRSKEFSLRLFLSNCNELLQPGKGCKHANIKSRQFNLKHSKKIPNYNAFEFVECLDFHLFP